MIKPRNWGWGLLGSLLVLLLAGCVTLKDPETSMEHSGEIIAAAAPGQIAGQTFISRRARLNGLSLWVDAPQGGGANLRFNLYHQPGELLALRTLELPPELAHGSPLELRFEALNDPPGQSYYLTVESGGRLGLRGRGEDIYPGGSAWLNGAALDADLAFTSSYEYGLAAGVVDLASLLRSAWLVLPLSLVLLLPGWLLVAWVLPAPPGGERLALALGLSLAITPVLMTWTTLLRLPWTQPGVFAAAGLLCVLAFWQTRRKNSLTPAPLPVGEGGSQPPKGVVASSPPLLGEGPGVRAALLFIFLFTLAIRLLMVRDLAAPPWVDPVHHGMITRLILEHGGFPDSYLPYVDIDGARYHVGFHSLLAVFMWLSGLAVQPAMLLFGQILNALIVFPVYLLACQITGGGKTGQYAGLFAAILAGVFTPMPAYYTSWGRYTQLAGLLILPAAFWLIDRARQNWAAGGWRASWRSLLLAGLACAGVFLVHYRVAAFLACLLVADFAQHAATSSWAWLVHRLRRQPAEAAASRLWPYLASVAITAGISLLLVLPWLPDTLTSLFIPKLSAWRGGHGEPFEGFAWTFLTSAWGQVSLYLAGVGLAWGLLRRKVFPFTLAAWCGLMFLIANLEPLGLPGGGFITSLAVGITLFMPVAVAGGFVFGDVYNLGRAWLDGRYTGVPAWLPGAYRLLWAAVGLAAMFGAGRALLPILRPITFLARQADAAGLRWLAENTPQEARILINPAAWGYGLYQGQDGGYWVTPASGRRSLPPPVLYGLDNNQERVLALNQLSKSVLERANDPAALQMLLNSNDIDYIFLGGRGGALSPRRLNGSGLFPLLFAQDGVWIFGVNP